MLYYKHEPVTSLCTLHGLDYIKARKRKPLDQQLQKVIATTLPKPKDDYWIIEGETATIVHVKPRLHKFIPVMKTTMPVSKRESDTWLHRLSDAIKKLL